jgi:hypothetical protein
MQDSWPSAEHEAERASPLPRVEDLPYVERGYDPERVHEAFDAFYRHLARLDATLRTIEAVEVFRGQADELRKELRALRTSGWTQQPWLPSYATRESARPGVPEAVFRWALEAAFVIAVPVAASVADLRSLWIVVAAAGAFAIVAITEWAASHERDVLTLPAPVAPPAPVEEPEPAAVLPPVEPAPGEATEWTLPPPVEEPEEEAQQEELTVVGAAESPAAEPEPEPAVEPAGEAVVVAPVEPVAEAEAEPEPPALPEEPAVEPVAQAVEPEPVEPAAEAVVVEPHEPAAEPEPPPALPEEPAAVEPEPVVEPAPEAVEPEPQFVRPEEPAAEEPEPSRRRRFRWRRDRIAEEPAELEPDDARPKHVRVLPAEAVAHVEPLDPWEEELDAEPEPEADREPSPRR